MMAKKNNIRSIRFSDEMIEMIESQAGDSFTAKFEALVTRCMWELPRKEEELKQIQEQIDYQRKKLSRISKQAYELENTMYRLGNSVGQYSNMVKREISTLEKMCITE